MDTTNLSKGIIDHYNLENERFDKYVLSLNAHSSETKELFLRQEPFSLTGNIAGINYITAVYHNIVFFPDQELYNKFSDFGIRKESLRWLIPINELTSQFKNLEDSGIIIYKCAYIQHLIVYLSIQISLDTAEWGEIYEETRNGKRQLTPTSQIEKALGRINYNAKRKNKLTREQEAGNKVAQYILEVEKDANLPKNTIIGMVKGKIRKQFLVDWLKESFPYTDEVLKGNLFLQTTLPLHRFVFKDKHIPELEDIGTEEYKGKSIETIQAQFLRKWFFKK